MPEQTFSSPKSILAGLDAENVYKRPQGLAHSIFDELWHLEYWQTYTLQVIRQDSPPYTAKAEDSWPKSDIEPLEELWQPLYGKFMIGLEEAVTLAGAEQISAALQDQLVDLALHNAYHYGRIVTLRQLLRCWPTS